MAAASVASGSAAAPIRASARIVTNEAEGSGRRLVLEVPGWPGARPGQFVMLGAGAASAAIRRDPLLPRPMAVYRDRSRDGGDGEPGEIEILYRVVGRGTTLLSEAESGQSLSIVGPLGRGFPIEDVGGPALLVGGGSGIASLYELAAALSRAGRPVQLALGARSAADLIGRDDFAALPGVSLVCTTEDGSYGEPGRVTGPLEEWLDRSAGNATVFACGPTPMMRVCAELAAARGARCLVSLENPMACGFGVCLGCAAPRREGGFSLVCRDGPVFEASEIAWEGMP
ncbi:MAG: dihydroorotate dehydrogenase electron transfer subunit [Deltaproteobacteria bacterium]|nr:dihydroorotate dehydrogenase electron transfer subunit [Deltaproteobacteria bacterium]